MKKAKMMLHTLLHPAKWVRYSLPPAAFAALILIFASEQTESALAYPVYLMSAYSLAVLIAALPVLARRIRQHKTNLLNRSKLMQKIASSARRRALSGPRRRRSAYRATALCIASSAFGDQYLHDPAFRGSVSIYQGMIVNFLYMLFRIATGIRYASVWFISMAVYYMVLGGLRAYLISSYRRREAGGLSFEYCCYRRTAWLLFLLNIPMGGMIVLMVRTNSGFFYPGYIIYLSALYTFYTMAVSIVNLVKFRKLGSPILSAAKVLNFVSAMMSILGLQTAMISRFSVNGENYRRLMNAVTGGFVYGIVVMIAVYMLLHSRKIRKKGESF